MAIRGLLFDLDGLLVDTETPARAAYEELYREHGHELPLDKWATLVGTIGAEFDPDAHLEELVGRPLDRAQLTERRRTREFELCDLEDLRPGIEDYPAGASRRGRRRGCDRRRRRRRRTRKAAAGALPRGARAARPAARRGDRVRGLAE